MNQTEWMRQMSPTDLMRLGVPQVAYVKTVFENDAVRYEIHAADGSHMGSAPDRDLAFAAIRQHDLEPVSVH